MHWKVKAAIQNKISILPRCVSDAAYFRMQRLFGGLKRSDPINHLAAGIRIWRQILERRLDPVDKVFFEVGTRATPIVLLAFWLMGAKATITVDINRVSEG